MPTITAIKVVHRDKSRCSIFVDDVFTMACPVDAIATLGIKKGDEFTEDLERVLSKENTRSIIKSKVYSYATFKPRTRSQVRDYLEKLNVPESLILELLEWLGSFDIVDDVKYAQRFLEASKVQKPLSRLAAARMLTKKGIPSTIVKIALENFYSEDDNFNAAVQVAEKKLRSLTGISDNEKKEKVIRTLQYRGYAWNVISAVLAKLFILLGIALPCVVHAQILSSASECAKERLPESLNRFQPTTMPVLGTGGVLYVDRKLHPENEEGANDADDVWMAERDNFGRWLVPLHKPFSTFRRPDVVFSITGDGLHALVAGKYRVDQGDTVRCFALASRVDTSSIFTIIKPINLPGVLSIGKNFFATMSNDKTHIIAALERKGGLGSLDLYSSVFCNGVWSELVPLQGLNTTGLEGSPCISSDNRTLFFTSNGRDDRIGKSDIYVTRRIGNSWADFEKPKNLGSCINSVEDETSISVFNNGYSALITSWDREAGRPGIYTVDIPEYAFPQPMIMGTITVQDAHTTTKIEHASLKIKDSAAVCDPIAYTVRENDGESEFVLEPRTTYTITASAPGYVTQTQKLVIRTLDSITQLKLSMKLFPETKPLSSVYFERGNFTVSREYTDTLQKFIGNYRNRGISFEVVGYTDQVGLVAWNKSLAQQRASAVKATLIKLGIPEEKIKAAGRGIENPGTMIGLHENPQSRRVDIFPVETAKH